MTRYSDYFLECEREPEGFGSRFSKRPAVAFVPDQQLEYDVHVGIAGGLEAARHEAVRRAIGEWALAEQPDLGAPQTVDGSYGKGAEAWAVVLEWTAQGVVGGVAWVSTVALARQLRAFLDRFRSESRTQAYVSAGAAQLLAVGAVVAQFDDESGPLQLEAVEDAETIGGQEPFAVSYDEEPWIVLLVSGASYSRYVVVVEANGRVAGTTKVPLGPRARAFAEVENETRRDADEPEDG